MMHKNQSKGVHVRSNKRAMFSVSWQVLLVQQGLLQAAASQVHSPKAKPPLKFPREEQALGWLRQQAVCRLSVAKSVSHF